MSEPLTDGVLAAMFTMAEAGESLNAYSTKRVVAELRALRERDIDCRLCHCCNDAPNRHGEILSEWIERAEQAETENAALKDENEKLRVAIHRIAKYDGIIFINQVSDHSHDQVIGGRE